MPESVHGNRPRRRRSWYRRRLRNRRILTVSILLIALVGVGWQALARRFRLPTVHVSRVMPASFWERKNLRQEANLGPGQFFVQNPAPKYVNRIPGVYPYSVVPGGIRSIAALRQAAALDRAVARHYAHFDYERARLVRVTEPRLVYVSYRIRDTVFWTRKRVQLHVGEMLLTDGKITARARCGNQISDAAMPEVSNEEPEDSVLDQPVALEPFGRPVPIHTAFAMPELPAGDPLPPKLFASGFSFPYVSTGIGAPTGGCKFENGEIDKHCHPRRPRPVVPEPSSLLLLASGFAFVGWRYRSMLTSVRS